MPHIPPFRPDPRLFPFESHWFEGSAGRLHYLDEGRGPPLLLLHGNPTWSFLYRGIVIRLRSRFRCVAPDYPGFGLSEHPEGYGYTPGEHARAVGELVRHLGLEGVTIMGHDWGGPIGLRVAVEQVRRLRALVMGNTWYWPAEDWRLKGFSHVMGSQPLQWLIRQRAAVVEHFLRAGTKHELAPEVVEHYRAPFPTAASRHGVAELPRQILAAAPFLGDLADDVPRVLSNVPLLLAWGMHDIAFPARFMDRFRDDFRLVTVRRLDAQHYIQEDAPGEIAEAIGAFRTR